MDLLREGIEKGIVIKTALTKKLTIDGATEAYPVYKVKLDSLFFNDQNDRIATWIIQYKEEKKIKKLDMSDINVYNDIIQEFIYKSNPEAIKKTQNNIELVDQREPGVVLADGRIIDGNRRFSCLRNLSVNNPRFAYFETVILEKNLENNAKQIKMLELMIQHGEESKVDYNPIDRLVGIHNDVVEHKLLTAKEYALSTNMTEVELYKQVELSMLLVEFLESINAPKQFYIARDFDLSGPLMELQGILKKIKEEEEKAKLKTAVFTNFLVQPYGDMTRFMRKIKMVANSRYLNDYLSDQMNISRRVLGKLPEAGKVTKKYISDVFRNDEAIKNELIRSLEKTDMKAKSAETRNKPLQTLEKIGNTSETIDINIFTKLNKDQLAAIVAQLDKLDETLQIIRAAASN